MGPTWIKKKKTKLMFGIRLTEAESMSYVFVFFSFFSFLYFVLRFTSFGPSEFVGINTKSALRDEGYA